MKKLTLCKLKQVQLQIHGQTYRNNNLILSTRFNFNIEPVSHFLELAFADSPTLRNGIGDVVEVTVNLQAYRIQQNRKCTNQGFRLDLNEVVVLDRDWTTAATSTGMDKTRKRKSMADMLNGASPLSSLSFSLPSTTKHSRQISPCPSMNSNDDMQSTNE